MLINLVPIQSGGGLQNALSLLSILASEDMTLRVICRSGSAIEQFCDECDIPTWPVRNRLMFELYGARRIAPRGTVCFSLFGPPPRSTVGYWVNVCGVAYSNLFYEDVDFWAFAPFLSRTLRQAKDGIRRSAIARADGWIFETKILLNRAIARGFPKHRTFHVPMAVSKLVSQAPVRPGIGARDSERMKILYLATAHPNKRQHLVPKIASELEALAPGKYTWITTMDEKSPYTQDVLALATKFDPIVEIANVGPVDPAYVRELIDSVDALCLFSVLESFSNNFVESWASERPIFVTDSDWARASCRDGAVYINPLDAADAAARIHDLLSDPERVASVCAAGRMRLAQYPSADEKARLYVGVLDRFGELQNCPIEVKRKIWKKGS